jgi:glycosyltransferase involved in cell wall biosynthesis
VFDPVNQSPTRTRGELLSGAVEDKRVFIFLDTMPQRQGSGASLRFYSNVRAYLDLGFDVEVIQIASSPDGSEPSRDLEPVVWTRIIERPPSPTALGRVMFRWGIPRQASFTYYVPQSRIVRREAEIRRRRAPGAIYHFEGEAFSPVIPAQPRTMRCIWSLHDPSSTVAAAIIKIASEAQHRPPTVAERRELRFTRRMERYVARHTPLILCISDHDAQRLRSEWDCERTEYLPMSIPGDGADRKAGIWVPGGRLRLLHVGRVSHLPSYRSLEFLFEKVFPILPHDVLARMSMDVIGTIEPDSDRARRILALAAPYPNVVFRGFVDDVIPYYEQSDVQVVAATDASGLRTRTIESFAYGLPVLSTSVGARGIAGLKPGEHLLIADDATQFAQELTRLTLRPDILATLSRSGRAFYCANQSRAAVARRLACYLRQYFDIRSLDSPRVEAPSAAAGPG